MRLSERFTSAALGAALFLTATSASAALIDFVGFGWEQGGINPSTSGDVLDITATTSQIDALFGVDLSGAEVTLHFYDLVSNGEFHDPVSGWTIISYSGGMVDVRSDPSFDADWGVFPPNATSPATFDNGELLFRGSFTSFTLTLAANGSGALEGMADGIAGSQLANICSGCAYGFAGVFTASTGAQLLDGYDMQIDGTLDINSSVPVAAASSWGNVKSLYGER